MKLYDRDYTKLTADEETIWKLQCEKEVVVKFGTSEFRQSHSLFDYPKAVRHFISFFPNNYLDIVELRDETGLKSKLDQFRRLIDSDDTSERGILNFNNQNHAYFIIGSILKKYFDFGHHDAFLFKEFQLGNSYRTDYLLVGRNSHGWHFVFIELEAPVGKITLKNGELGLAFRKGLEQVANWDIWLQAQYNSLKETFDKYRRADICLPDEFFTLDTSRIHYVVVAGRRTDFKANTYRIRRNEKMGNSKLILHYDNLVDAAENIIGENTY